MSTLRTIGCVLLLTACVDKGVPTKAVARTERSILLAEIVNRADLDMVSQMQERLISGPALSGRVASQGWAGPNLFTVEFDGTCAAHDDLVAALGSVLRAEGATETSCVPAKVFRPGEPVTFRR